jgi:BolA protein
MPQYFFCLSLCFFITVTYFCNEILSFGEAMTSVESRIVSKLTETFQPTYLQVINESYLHSVPVGSETHFNVALAADCFVGKRQVQRHQAIYACLAAELQNGVHALALHTFSPNEWSASGQFPASPVCLGGGYAQE